MMTKILNRHQTCWTDILSGYDFVLDHITDSKNPANGPSHCSDYVENIELPISALILQSPLYLLPLDAGATLGNSP